MWTAFDAGQILPACAWCGRVRIDDTWLVPPLGILAAIDQRNMFSHSICDGCPEMLSSASARNSPMPVRPRDKHARRAGGNANAPNLTSETPGRGFELSAASRRSERRLTLEPQLLRDDDWSAA